jgi:hypothetical protein
MLAQQGSGSTQFPGGHATKLQKPTAQDVFHNVSSASIRDSVISQLYIHYFMFVVLVASASSMGLSSDIRNYTLFLYANAALYVLQISRICYFLKEKSIIPFYLSLVPFSLVCVISREAHMLVTALWYVSFLIIYLQMGRTNMQKHLVGYSFGFLCTYVLSVAFMDYFYRDGCRDFFCGRSLRDGFHWAQEILYITACVILILCFMTLERFIKFNALTLLERENFVHNLLQANVELKKELKRIKMDQGADLDAPLTRVIQVLKDIRGSGGNDQDTNQSLDMVVKILTSGDLFGVDLQNKPADADVVDFLSNLMQKGGTSLTANPSTMPSISTFRRVNSMMRATNPSNMVIMEQLTEPGREARESSARESFILDESDEVKGFKIEAYIPKEILEITPDGLVAIEECLRFLESPDFDVLELNDLSHGHPLYFVGMRAFEKHKISENLHVDPLVMKNFLLSVEAGYLSSNPYHNVNHAADVTASMHYYLSRQNISSHLPPIEVFGAIIAASIHDLGHPGFNNQFLINIGDRLALQYNDQSVLEHYHCSLAFTIMRSSQSFNVLDGFNMEDLKSVRDTVVTLVLATDMSCHFELLTKFKNKITSAPNGVVIAPGMTNGFDLTNKKERSMVLSIAMKCADINNPSKPLHLCTRWTDLIMEEFFRQGDEERRRGLEISPLMDRFTTDVPKCQVVCISVVYAANIIVLEANFCVF